MRRVVIVGASSAIAEATARIYAEAGDALFLVARNADAVRAMASDLQVRGAHTVTGHVMDANDLAAHAGMFAAAATAMGDIDIVLIAHGTLPDQAECQQSVAKTLEAMNTNALSVVSLLTHAANRLEKSRAGTIAVISSVAGDRGRQSNYVYGSAKALVTAFLSGLRQRLNKAGVAVVTIKPGFVDTPMTAHLKKSPLWAKPDAVARTIVAAIAKRKPVCYTPLFWWPIMTAIRIIPERLFMKLAL